MTNSIAIVLAVTVLTAISLDLMVFGSQHMVFLGKKLFEFIEWLAFWR